MDLMKKVFKGIDDAVNTMTRDKVVKDWLEKLGEAAKREKNWRKKAQECIEIYESEGSSADAENLTDYNILYANVETLSPAVYNNTPRPVVKRKADKENPVAVAAANVLKGVLVFQMDTGKRDEATFDDLQKAAVMEALLPGRGLARFGYEAKVEDIPASEDGTQPAQQQLQYECIYGDQVPWNRVVYGYAKQWHKVPWQAYEHFMTREECVENFGEAVGKTIKLTHMASTDKDDENSKMPADAEGVKFAHIWEIWDKGSKKVMFLSDGHPSIIKETADPLQLEGFFDCPRPISYLNRVSSLQPQTLYQMYEKQAKELEKATRRISGILEALKVRGFYDGTLEGLDQLLTQPDLTLMPAMNAAALQQGQTLDKSIWFMPLQELIVVLTQLYAARGQIINTIHQLTGIADIMRGASQASETLGAQEIKQAWGTMRLKRMQKETQRFTRDCFRIQAELAAKHFGIDTLQTMTGMKFPRQQDKEMAQQQLAQIQQEVQQAGGGQPPPPEMQKQIEAKMQPLQQTLAQPSWEDIQQFLRTDNLRNYIIDIETNSTIDIEATEDKAELAEMMNSMGQVMNGVFPMVEKGVLPFEAAKQLTLAIINKFRLGDEVETTYRAMREPPPKPDPKAEADKAKMAAEAKQSQEKHASDMQMAQIEMQNAQQLAQQELQNARELAAIELQIRREELEMRRQELQMEQAFKAAKHERDMQALTAKTNATLVTAEAQAAAAAAKPAQGSDE
jgi:hypothetical protein